MRPGRGCGAARYVWDAIVQRSRRVFPDGVLVDSTDPDPESMLRALSEDPGLAKGIAYLREHWHDCQECVVHEVIES